MYGVIVLGLIIYNVSSVACSLGKLHVVHFVDSNNSFTTNVLTSGFLL